jgi:organic radical activating enzyme
MNLPQKMETFIESARQGDSVESRVFVEFASQFKSIVIWGAGNLGTALGKKLLAMGLGVSAYWDVRTEEIKTTNGISVIPVFSGNFVPQESLIIFAITNNAVAPVLRKNLEKAWPYNISGEDLLFAFFCPLSNTDREPDPEPCNSMPICYTYTCKRLDSIYRNYVARSKNLAREELLFSRNLTLFASTFCSLNCTHCNVYMNSYPKSYRKNVSTQRILSDISILMRAVDGFGHVLIQGGEPFLHKNISKIIENLLGYHNYGPLSIVTNGAVKIKTDALLAMQSPRVRLNFSNYAHVYNEQQKNIFLQNRKNASIHNIHSNLQNVTPNWIMPNTLDKKNTPVVLMRKKKEKCNLTLVCYDGKVFPCQFSLSLSALGVADYPTDYVALDAKKPIIAIREDIRSLLSRPCCYQSCAHCSGGGDLVPAAGQGFDARYTIPIHPQ